MLLSTPFSSHHVGINTPTEKQSSEIRKLLVCPWFSSARLTEPMMRGSISKRPVLCSLSCNHFIKEIYECGMLSMIGFPLIFCSPDAVAFIDERLIGMGGSFEHQLVSVETKTSVASSSVERALQYSSHDVTTFYAGDDTLEES